MNRLTVGRSARSQQAHKVDNRINRLMDLHKTDAGIPSASEAGLCVEPEFCSAQDRHPHTHTHGHGRTRILVSAKSRLWQTMKYFH